MEERPSQPDGDTVESIEALCDRARFATALGIVAQFPEPEIWTSPPALAAAARLAAHLGARERGHRLALRAYRRDPSNARATFWTGTLVLDRRGPWATLRWLADRPPPTGAGRKDGAAVPWLRAAISIALRDFDAASEALDEAERRTPGDPYTGVLRVGWLIGQDRYGEASEAAGELLARFPENHGTVRSAAELHLMHGDFEGALRVLEERAPRLECGELHLEIASLRAELHRWPAVAEAVDAAERVLPWADEATKRRLGSHRVDVAYYSGHADRAARLAADLGGDFHDALARRIASSKSDARALLTVPFVRQHHLTCVPASLTMLGTYWSRPVAHLEVADAICFNGTTAHAARTWARENGWVCREFTTTWEAARALLDRKIPFTVDTVHATTAHAQVIIGYDARRGTLSIRDPYVPVTLEAAAEPFLESYAAHGPRGMVLVPEEDAGRIDEIVLPDTELYEIVERVEAALERHDRAAASAAADELAARAPDHRLVLLSRRALAAYDRNPFASREVAEAALARWPNEATWLTSLLGALRETVTPGALLERLEELCRDASLHPVFREILATELLMDGRHHDRAARLLRGVARQLVDRATTLARLADCEWQALRPDVALELYRIAACLEPTSDRWAMAYFKASLVRGRAAEGLAFLERRVETYSKRSGEPASTLFAALELLDRSDSGFAVLERASAARPSDGALLTFTASALARYGRIEEARSRLAAAEGHVSRRAWLATAADVATHAGEHELAIQRWRELLEIEPLALDAHEALAQRLTVFRGPAAAREHLLHASRRFPENPALLEAYVRWLGDEDPERRVDLLRRVLVLQPSNAWARRELALVLARLGRTGEALAESDIARAVEPDAASGSLVHARVLELSGDAEGVRASLEDALDRSADCALAISSLVEMAADSDECLALLARIEERVRTGSVAGDGVLAWFSAARRHCSTEEMGRKTDRLRAERGDLWAAWSCAIEHLARSGDASGALALGREASQRFSLHAPAWLALGRAAVLAGELDAAAEAFDRASALAPGRIEAVLELAAVEERRTGTAEALDTLERGLRASPLDERLALARAEALWRLDRRSEAMAAVRAAIEAAPQEAPAWSRLREWSQELEGEPSPEALANELAARRPWDSRIWVRLAEAQAVDDPALAFETTARAVAAGPQDVEAWDLRAMLAARLGHRGLAVAASRPGGFAARPLELRGREAWVHGAFGDVEAAIAAMREVVGDRPDYAWGWQQLADWAESVANRDLGLEAAGALVRLEPNVAVAHGYHGQALLDAGDRKSARRAFRRALELDPSYEFAAHSYLDLLVGDGKHERALREIRRLSRHVGSGVSRYWELRLHAEAEEWAEASRAFSDLLLDDDAPPRLVEAARAKLGAMAPSLALRVAREAAEAPGAPPAAGAAWASALLDAGKVPSWRGLRRLRVRNPGAAAAAMERVLDHLGERERGIRALLVALPHWRFVRRSPVLWGNVGYALTNAGWFALGIAWLWNPLAHGPRPWMLLNLGIACRNLGLLAMATSVSRDALALPPDHTSPQHALLLALDAAMVGNAVEAETLLADVSRPQLPEPFRVRYDLAEVLGELHRARAPERAELVARGFLLIGSLLPNRLVATFGLRAIEWRRVLRRLGALGGTVGDRVAGSWDSALFAALLCAPPLLLVSGHGALLLVAFGWWLFGRTLRALWDLLRS